MSDILAPIDAELCSNLGGPVASLWSTGRLKRCHVLGDASEFEEKLAETRKPRQQPTAASTALIDEKDLPEHIQRALGLSPDAREAILEAYQQLMNDRELLVNHLSTLRASEGKDSIPKLSWFNRTISEEIRSGQDERVLEKWDQQQQVWNAVSHHLATVTGRPEEDLAMSRGEEWREREEILEHLLKSIPLNKRGHGAEQWRMGLRGAWERWVPVGSLFSGLFAAVYDKPSVKDSRELLKVFKHGESDTKAPLAASERWNADNVKKASTSLRNRQRSWADSSWLSHQQTVYKRNMKDLQPHDPDMQDLVVIGESIRHKVWDVVNREITLEDVLKLLDKTDPETALKIKGDSLQNCAGQENIKESEVIVPENSSQEDAEAPYNGPRLDLAEQSLTFHSQPDILSQTVLTILNTGSTAVYYDWIPKKPNLPKPAVGGKQETRFFLFDRKGVILPGHHKDFRFAFRSSHPGRFVEQWTLHTVPTTQEPIHTVTLRGFATIHDKCILQRKQLDKKLKEREKIRKVKSAVEYILRNVKSQPFKPPLLDEDVNRKRALFNNANATELPPLYYEASSFDKIAAMYSDVITKQQPPVVEEDKPVKGAKGNKGGKEGGKRTPAPETPQEELPPEDWDGSIQTMAVFIAKMEEHFPEDGSKCRESLKRISSNMRIPFEEKDIVVRAVRNVVLKCAQGIEDRVGEVLKESIKQFAEAQVEEEANEESKEKQDDMQYDPEVYSKELRSACKEVIGETLLIEEQILLEKTLVHSHLEELVSSIDTMLDSNPDLASENAQHSSWAKFCYLRKMNRLGLTEC